MSAVEVRSLYRSMEQRLARARKAFGRPLTLSEKILVSHCWDFERQKWDRGRAILKLRVDRVAMQDVTGQMALLQFMHSGRKRVAVPSTLHCDHLIRAETGSADDLARAIKENEEVYNFLRSASRKYGIGFWKPSSGIIHQVVLENYAFPGGLMIGADSHTPNGGGLGMLAIGVGGADCGEVMAGLPWEVLHPKLIGVRLTGKLSGWTAPKDVITYLCTLLTVKGGTNKIIEYLGPGAESISATGKGTICNMGAELGATTSVFPFDARMEAYLRATDRADVAELAAEVRAHLTPDPEVLANPKPFYDELVEIDLDALEPHIVGPHSPDRGRPISKLAAEVRANGWPARITNALIGSCTNSSYEDMRRAPHVQGKPIRFTAPEAEELPRDGFARGAEGYEPPADDPDAVQVIVRPNSERLQILEPFKPWGGKDFVDLPILLKTKGKTTTDHISPAGPWLRFRGHIDKISDNMFLGAVNAFTGEAGKGVHPLSGGEPQPFTKIARDLKAKGVRWMVIGDENYGEGSSREHAAMSPRYLGCAVVLVKSFARIHETNLKKQGIPPRTFKDPRDYDRFGAQDRVSVTGLAKLAPGKPVTVTIRKPDGRTETIEALHSLTDEHIAWFKAGSALNAAQGERP